MSNKKYLILLLIVVTLFGGIVYSQVFQRKNKTINKQEIINDTEATDTNVPQEIASNSAFPTDNTHVGVIILGYGGAGHDGGYLTDAIQFLYADFTKGILTLISIPRDLWVKLPNNSEAKINTVYVSGAKTNTGATLTKQVVSQIIGLPTNYVIAVDFVGLQKLIGENLKGIEVDVSETLDDPWYPIKGEEQNLCGKTPEETTKLTQELSGFELEKQFTCRYEHLRFEKGINNMQGGDALKYVRSRHGSSDGDISRGRRTQDVLSAIGKKLFLIKALDDIPGFFKLVSKNIQTDLDAKIIDFFASGISKANTFKVIKINLSTTNVLQPALSSNKQSIFIPKTGMFDYTEIHQYIKNEINK